MTAVYPVHIRPRVSPLPCGICEAWPAFTGELCDWCLAQLAHSRTRIRHQRRLWHRNLRAWVRLLWGARGSVATVLVFAVCALATAALVVVVLLMGEG